MYEFHGNKKYYFDMTYAVTKGHIIPFLEKNNCIKNGMNVLEIGCGEAGVLKAFTELNHQCVGIELEESRLEFACEFMTEEIKKNQISFLNKNIYDVDIEKDLGEKFDLIILKDVIEHIPNQEKFIPQLHRFLNPNGVVFFAFPPWYMPFGGHQQVLPSKFLSKLPYFHLFPWFIYKGIMQIFRIPQKSIDVMKEIKDTGISIERFLRINKNNNFEIAAEKYYLFNPIYEYKFNLKPRVQWNLISKIPFIRNFLTMGVYFIAKSNIE